MRKKFLYCPICGSKGEDLIFAFYCMNPNCQNFRDEAEKVIEEDEKEFYYEFDCWPYED